MKKSVPGMAGTDMCFSQQRHESCCRRSGRGIGDSNAGRKSWKVRVPPWRALGRMFDVASRELTHRNPSRRAWDQLAQAGCFCSEPYGAEEFQDARQRLDFKEWIPWQQIKTVLCLAAGGGQQSGLFASLGCRVTVIYSCRRPRMA
jgi:hypothetical protein